MTPDLQEKILEMNQRTHSINLAKLLLPCRECGAKPRIIGDGGWYHVECPSCGLKVRMSFPSPFDATADWNCLMAKKLPKGNAQ